MALLQSLQQHHQSRALAGAWCTVHVETAFGVVDGEEGDALHVECLTQ